MTNRTTPLPLLQGLQKSDYDIKSLDDEIRVDQLCVALIRHLYHHLTQEPSCAAEEAGEICHGIDYFLREFIIPDRNLNLFEIDANQIRQFAGHWYITRTVEPNMTELSHILAGTNVFYRFLGDQGLISTTLADEIDTACKNLDFYASRIESFWAIEEDGYDTWRQACPLDESTTS